MSPTVHFHIRFFFDLLLWVAGKLTLPRFVFVLRSRTGRDCFPSRSSDWTTGERDKAGKLRSCFSRILVLIKSTLSFAPREGKVAKKEPKYRLPSFASPLAPLSFLQLPTSALVELRGHALDSSREEQNSLPHSRPSFELEYIARQKALQKLRYERRHRESKRKHREGVGEEGIEEGERLDERGTTY